MMNLFWIGTDSLVHQSYWTSGMFHDQWTTTLISSYPANAGGLSAVSMNSNHMEVFWTSPGGTLYHAYWTTVQNRWISEPVLGPTGTLRCQPGSYITTVARKGKNTIEGWCRSVESKLNHFYYYAINRKWLDMTPAKCFVILQGSVIIRTPIGLSGAPIMYLELYI
jgi:hypothetical protein